MDVLKFRLDTVASKEFLESCDNIFLHQKSARKIFSLNFHKNNFTNHVIIASRPRVQILKRQLNVFNR